uniref:Prokaryotic-type class I peptide chain release factors domain-containing protein n=1 Tax=Panagrolaimus sp. PS1159 TaxID=55785 RepID=A0AC35GQH8_9BILA
MLRFPRFIKFTTLHYSIRNASRFATIIENEKCKKYCEEIVTKFKNLKSGDSNLSAIESNIPEETISRWQQITDLKEQLKTKEDELKQLKEMEKSDDGSELKAAIEEDITSVTESIDDLYDNLALAIVEKNELDVLSKCQLEFAAGAGGVESMIFAEEIFEMYRKHAEYKGWTWLAIQHETVPPAGLRSALVLVEGPECYSSMRFEAGTHRVQRVPFNASIMHTSTMSLAVLPEPENAELTIPANEVKIEAMRASGPGGQNVNKRSTAVRITHLPTGTSVHVMDERFQHMNIKIAHKRLAAILLQKKVDELSAKTMSARKLQVGSRARAEKIRTFNFKEDRITDHRLKMSTSHIKGFMEGGLALDLFMEELRYLDLTERLQEIVNNEL